MDPPNHPKHDDPSLMVALLRKAASMPLDDLEALVKHVEQVIRQKPHAEDN